MKITMKISGSFKGAESKKQFRFQIGDTLTVDPKDIVHLSKSDYLVGEAEKPASKDPAKDPAKK